MSVLTVEQFRKTIKKPGRSRGVAPKEERTYNGIVYHSKLEAQHAAKLDLLLRYREMLPFRLLTWVRQVRMPITVNGVFICNYFADFRLLYDNGDQEVHECKGFETEVWKIKEKLVRACYPGIKLIIIRG